MAPNLPSQTYPGGMGDNYNPNYNNPFDRSTYNPSYNNPFDRSTYNPSYNNPVDRPTYNPNNNYNNPFNRPTQAPSRHRRFIKCDLYDGTTSWQDFLAHFERIAHYNGWEGEEKA